MRNTYAFDFNTNEFVLKCGDAVVLQGINALKTWIEKTLRTQYGRYKLYRGKEYGSNIEDLVIGKTYKHDFAESELKREIETALLRHEDIYALDGFLAERAGTVLNIRFILTTSYGKEELSFDLE